MPSSNGEDDALYQRIENLRLKKIDAELLQKEKDKVRARIDEKENIQSPSDI